jgi:hypothetical protein
MATISSSREKPEDSLDPTHLVERIAFMAYPPNQPVHRYPDPIGSGSLDIQTART